MTKSTREQLLHGKAHFLLSDDDSKPHVHNPLQVVAHDFRKHLYQTRQEYQDELAAKREELRVWSEHCEKRGLWQHFVVDNPEIKNPSNRLELLYFCPIKLDTCFIMDIRQYNRLLARRMNNPQDSLDGCCLCGWSVNDFKSFLPSKEYIEKHGEGYLRNLKGSQKDK